MRNRLTGLDALRGIAALAVALYHLGELFGGKVPLLPQIAVDLFFILSGFVMARTYEAKMRDGLTAVQFIGIRYRRLIFPLFVGATIGLLWAVLKVGWWGEALLSYALLLAFLPTWWWASAFALNVPAWSLFLEICANALHGLMLGRMSNRAMVGLWLLTTAIFLALFFAGKSEWSQSIGGILLLIPRELSCYLLGILMFRHYGDKPLGNRPLVALVALPLALILAPINPAMELMALVACPFIVRASLSLKGGQWAVWLGALSYPLYATHVPVIRLMMEYGFRPVPTFALALLLAWIVTKLAEIKWRLDPAPHHAPMIADGAARN